MQETWVGFLGQEDPPEEKTATHVPVFFLGNPKSREAWWATVHEATESWTRLSEHTFDV